MSLPALYSRAWTMLRSYNTDAGRQAARNLVGTVTCTILGQFCTLGTLLVLTHTLGKENYGIFSYAHFGQQYLLLFTTGALAQVVVREGMRNFEQMDEIGTAYLLVTGTLSGLVCLFAIVVAWLLPIDAAERYVLVLLALGNIPACMNVRCWYEIHHRQTRDSIITLIAEVATLGALLLLRWMEGLTVVAAAAVYVVKWAITSVALLAVYHVTVRRVRFDLSMAHVWEMLRTAWPLMLASLVAMVPFNTGSVILRVSQGEGAAGLFGVAMQVALAYLTFSQVANRIVRPHILGPYGVRPSFIRKLILFKTGFLGTLMAVALAGSFVVIRYFLPASFRGALVPTALLLVGALLTASGRTAGNYMVLLQSERAFLIANLCAAAVYLAGSVALVPALSYTGSASMTVIASLVATGIIVASVRVRLKDVNAKTLTDTWPVQ
jgi:O-antigen/teichoic acid export membrane protein